MPATLGSYPVRRLSSEGGSRSGCRYLGRRSTLAHASSADQTTWGYDGAGRLTSLVHNVASTANDVTFTLARNAGGQIRSATTLRLDELMGQYNATSTLLLRPPAKFLSGVTVES